MKAAIYQGIEDIRVVDIPVPVIGDGQVLLRVHETGICGTDMQIYAGKHPRAKAPLVPGHEIFGTIECVADDVEGWKIGDRVAVYPLIVCGRCKACREGNSHVCERLGLVGIDRDGGFAEFVAINVDQLVFVPDSIPDSDAVIIEPLAVAVHAVHDSAFRVGDTVLITGGGPIGNLLAQTLRASGARQIVVSEVSEFRRGILERMDFATLDPSHSNVLDALTQAIGHPTVDIVFEASGNPTAYRDALRYCGVRGHISFVGIPKSPPEIDVQTIVYKEIHTSSARVYRHRDYAGAVALLVDGAVNAASLITHRVPLASAGDAYHLMKQADASGKIVIAPHSS